MLKEEIKKKCDEFISLIIPEEFWSVGLWYDEFTQVNDDEVLHYLQKQTNLSESVNHDVWIEDGLVMLQGLLNIPMKWITEITHVKENEFFVDEQRKGPYRIWHHEHHFKVVDGGVEMTDIVSYEIPFGIFGKIAHPLVVKKKLEEIFAFRLIAVDEIFND